jgi:hypothetical protein
MGRTHRAWKQWGKRSGFENRIQKKLELICGIRFEYEDRKYTYTKLICRHCKEPALLGTYTPDFNFYSSTSGLYLFTVEAKGKFDGADRSKLLAVRKANPDIDLRILFQRDQAICKGSKTLYSTWCIKHNFEYHFGEDLPLRWILDAKGD